MVMIALPISTMSLNTLITKESAVTQASTKIETTDSHKFELVNSNTLGNLISETSLQKGNTASSLNQKDSTKYVAKDEEIKGDYVESNKKVALTFDDGPHPKVTMQILEILKKYDAKATFFMLGNMVEKYPEIAKNVQRAGHELGNHAWSHFDLTNLGAEAVQNEIAETSAIIENTAGQKATVFRPPYGAVDGTVRNQTDLPFIFWDVDTLDWKHRDSKQLLTHVKDITKEGSTILMHDIHQSTADGLDAVLAYLQSEGYTFVTVSDLNN